ncbi:MAG: isocyanide synthase family protein [Alphaproteobacteria bacterium]|nr:isocyanide synthase family protein [Alphaproteobacteria bacterium]
MKRYVIHNPHTTAAHTLAIGLGLISPSFHTAPVQAESVSPKKTIRNSTQIEKVTKAILEIFKDYAIPYNIDRRSIDVSTSTMPEPITGFDKLEDKIRSFIKNGKRIELYMIGFPFKSSNKDKKTISPMPDMAERSAFVYLNKLLNRVTQLYPEGIRLTLVCDGAALSDVLGISDQHLVDFERTLCQLIKDMPSIRLITSKHLSEGITSLQALRGVIDHMPPTSTELENQLNTSKDMQSELDTTVKRLAFELDHNKGHRLIERQGLEEITKKVVTRGKRFSHFLTTHFPELKDMIKLTIHFQKDVSKKFGIKLSEDSNITPWHGVFVVTRDGKSTIQHKMDVDMNAFELTSESINGVWCPYFKAK